MEFLMDIENDSKYLLGGLFYKLWWVLNAENYPQQKNKEKITKNTLWNMT